MEKFMELCSTKESADREESVREVQSLLDSGQLDPFRRDDVGWYPIHHAAKFGRNEIVKLLLTRCDPHIETHRTRLTALHIASENNRLEVVETLLPYSQHGAPARRDREGNTPMHFACRVGSLEIVSRLMSKFPTNSIHEANRGRVTPLGYAVESKSASIARFILKQSVGNPNRKFSDFRESFPSFRYKQSLDHPVSIFVLGNRQTGKSTLIKSLQVEGYLNRTIGAFKSTSGVEHHSGGVVPSDVSSYGYGRVKFYELASCRQSTQENIFLSLEKSAQAIFVITVSFRDEKKEMEATLHYWLSFIHYQYRFVAASVRLNVAVVGSFVFYQKLGSLRLDNRHRLHLVYHKVLSAYSDLCSHFHFIGKFSMDCRRSESPGMRQLRGVLHRKSREMRPSGGESGVPSSCYVLLSALHELTAATSGQPILKLSDIERHIAEKSPPDPLSLLSLLPSHAEELKPILETLEKRKAVVVLDHLDPRDPLVIFDEYKLISVIDSTLIQKALRTSQASYFNPGIMSVEKLLDCLSPLSISLTKDVLLNILDHFKITEVVAHGNSTRYFLPSVLQISQSSAMWSPSWKPNDPNYVFGFAQCVLPQSRQTSPFFMPRFLYFMLYELFASTEQDDFDSVMMSHSALHCQLVSQLEVYVTVDSSTINLNMRCLAGGELPCLQYRNRFLDAIHQQRELLQPNLKVSEYIVPMEGTIFPLKKAKQIHANGIQVNILKNALIGESTSTSTESCNKLRSFEPYEWLSKLQRRHINSLVDPGLTNVEVGKEFIRDLAKCVGQHWKKLLEYSELLQDIETSADEPDAEPEESSSDEKRNDKKRRSPQRPHYGQLLELFSSMSIFHSNEELIAVLKDPKHYENTSSPNESPNENASQEESTGRGKPSSSEFEAKNDAHAESVSYLPASSTSSSMSIGLVSHEISHATNRSGQDISLPTPSSQPDTTTIQTCSSSSDGSSIRSMRFNVPNMLADKSTIPTAGAPHNVPFITSSEVLRCGATGARYQHDTHGISFVIPPQAVKEGCQITLEFAIAIVGPFTFPEGITPVSPILWVRIQAEGKLQKPLEIGLPHAVNCKENSKLLHFLCAQRNGDHYSFMKTHKTARINPSKGMMHSKLSKQQYFFCIAGKVCREVISKAQYCIVKVAPKHPYDYSWKLHFFVTYALPACIEMVRKQFGSDHSVHETGFQFDVDLQRDPSITVDYERVSREQWTLTREGTFRKIEASRVEFGNVNSFESSMMNRYHTYPPNFTIVVSGHQATGNSIVEFAFKGVAQSELVYEIPLMLPRKATTSISSTLEDTTFIDQEPETSFASQRSEERHLSIGQGRVSPIGSAASAQSEPVRSATVHFSSRPMDNSGYMSPRSSMRDQLNRQRQSAMSVLIDNFSNILGHMDNRAIRHVLYQLRALTDEECVTLGTLPPAEANERLFFIIKTKGINGFQQFMTALQKTSEDNPGHRDILDALTMDLKLAQSHSRSATQILGALPSSSSTHSHSLNEFSMASN